MAVYPRWRGEHYLPTQQPVRDIGLSPLTRGTLFLNETYHPKARFIPADAGNTLTASLN